MDERQKKIALLHTLLMAQTACWALIGCFLLRLPNGGVASVMGPMLSSSGAFGEQTRMARTARLAANVCSVSLLGFVQTNITDHQVLSLSVMFVMALMVHRLFDNALASSAIMVGSVLELKFTPYLASVDFAVTMLAITPLACWTYFLLDKYMLGKDDSTGFRKSPGLTWESSLRRSLAFTAGYFLVKATNTVESHWIIFTIGLAYMTGDIGLKARRVAMLRCFWAPLGLTLGVLFLYATGFQSDQLDYLTLPMGLAAFYTIYRTGNYSIYYLLFLLMVTLEYNWSSGPLHPFDDNYNYVIQSTVMIFLGSLVVYLLELRPGAPADATEI